MRQPEIDLKETREFTRGDQVKGWIPSFVVLLPGLYWIFTRGKYGLIDNADLVIHEAGHIFFFFFGRFICSAGGTLMQILLPSLIAWYFLKNNYRTGLQFSLLWLGQNFIYISVYAADAVVKRLPLLGGNKAGHDWAYMLGELNLLSYAEETGYLFYGIGIIIIAISVLLPLLIKE
jgi:hypothetical protein